MNPLKNERGGSLIEFVLIAWVLFLILFGIMEFGLIMYNQAVITNASREGARYGIVSRPTRWSEAEISAEVRRRYADRPITFGTREFIVNAPPPDCTTFGCDVTVEVTWKYDFLLLPNFTGSVFSNPLDLKATTVMKYE
jgi:hypothetical protein